jgi:hypothetical protein
MKKLMILAVLLHFICSAVFADAIRIKSRKVVNKKVVEKGEKLWVPSDFGSYKTSSAVELDGERNPSEWQACIKGWTINCGEKKEQRRRHEVAIMHDSYYLYLYVKTIKSDSMKCFNSMNAVFLLHPDISFRDGFPLTVYSETRQIGGTVLMDGFFYSWSGSSFPKKEEVEKYVEKEYGIDVKTKVLQDYSEKPDKSIEWGAEIRIPLSKIQPLGNRVFIEISGTKFRLFFFSKE